MPNWKPGVVGDSNQATINLSFNSSTGDYTLSSTDTNLVQISADKKSYIVKGITYTPIVDKSPVVNALYRLNSYQFPSASTVGTDHRSGTASGNPNTTNDYTSSEVRYYDTTTSSSYTYTNASINLSTITGVVEGDTSWASYTIDYDESYSGWEDVGTAAPRPAVYNGYTKSRVSGPSNAYRITWSNFGLQTPEGAVYKIDKATALTHEDGATTRYVPKNTNCSISYNQTDHITVGTSWTEQTRTLEKSNYRFKTFSWDSSISYNGYTWTHVSSYDSGGAGSSYASTKYRRRVSSTSYTTRCYSKFTFDSSTGQISWSHRSGTSTYYNKVEDNSTFDIDNLSTTTYTHNSTTWNADGLNIISQSKTSITLNIPTIAWEWYKNGVLYDSGDDIEVNGEKIDDLEIQ